MRSSTYMGDVRKTENSDIWSKREFWAFLEASARGFAELLADDDKEFFSKGRYLCEVHDRVVSGGRRAPDGEDIFIPFARALKAVAPNRAVGTSSLRNYVNAYRTWNALGGEKGKAPQVPYSMYERVSRADIDLDQRRQILERALHLRWNCADLGRFINEEYGRPRQSDTLDDNDALNMELARAFTNITGLVHKIRASGSRIDQDAVKWMEALAKAMFLCAAELAERNLEDAA